MVCMNTSYQERRRGQLVIVEISKPKLIVPKPQKDFCLHCEEPIFPWDHTVPLNNGEFAMHHACFMRGVIGSVGHQLGMCSCHGETDTSEIGMSRREAAEFALKFYNDNQRG